ncbi:cytochrome P450 [Nocardia nova]|uniref:cytochrome P450 n=1 Tax=Nocardia nova TaxID=37330 RepID=UPI00340B2117
MTAVNASHAVFPAGLPLPASVQGVLFLASRRHALQMLKKLYGPTFSARLPIFGRSVITSDPVLIKQVFQAREDVLTRVDGGLGQVLGPGSMFSLSGSRHQARRKLLVPPFHGRRMRAYEEIVVEETLREISGWPESSEFSVMPSMMRITVNIILRAVFGAEGSQLDTLRELLPSLVSTGSRLLLTPPFTRIDLGPKSLYGRYIRQRRQFDNEVESLIAKAAADPNFEDRDDVLSMMLRSRYDDGKPMSHSEIGDELLTLLAAGHETTATTLAWAVERLRRHPQVLGRLVQEIDQGGSAAYRQATIFEVQRTRPVILATARKVVSPSFELGKWTVPHGTTILVGIGSVHGDDIVFPGAATFDPGRFGQVAPDIYQWVPFGGGRRRCIGAAFANMEMNVVLRTVLEDFALETTGGPGERWHSRGIAFAPDQGGLAVVRRRKGPDRATVTHRGGETVTV